MTDVIYILCDWLKKLNNLYMAAIVSIISRCVLRLEICLVQN